MNPGIHPGLEFSLQAEPDRRNFSCLPQSRSIPGLPGISIRLQPLSECTISISLDLYPRVDIHGFISQLQGSPSVPPTVCSSQQEKVLFQWNHCPFFPVLTLRAGSGSFLFSPRAVKPGKKGKPGEKDTPFPRNAELLQHR